MCVVLSSSARANVAAALFNAVLGNAIGIVITPLLLVSALGRMSSTGGGLALAPALRKVGLGGGRVRVPSITHFHGDGGG